MDTETDGGSVQPKPMSDLLAPDRPTAHRVLQWLEEAWRHGEVVADDDSISTERPTHAVNRFLTDEIQ